MAHAKLPPSSSSRWMNCPGSVAKIGDETAPTNNEAMKGTAAHKVIEIMLKGHIIDAGIYKGMVALVKRTGDGETVVCDAGAVAIKERSKPESGWQLFPIDEEMIYGVQTMIDEVMRVRDTLDDPTLYTERFLDMSWLDSRLGGTADVTLVEFLGWIHLFDYKNGRVVVEVTSDQMKQYAVGLLHEHSECLGVVVHLVQPNSMHSDGIIRQVTYTIDELKLYEIQMKEAADATAMPNAPLRTGEWCTYCPANTRCEAFDAMTLEEAGIDFADDPGEPPPVVTDIAELARRAKWIPVLDGWVRSMWRQIEGELINGNDVPGFKLVRGRSNRKWDMQPHHTDETFAAILAEECELHVEKVTVTKLKSPAQVEKLGAGPDTKKLIKEVVGRLAIKPPGKVSAVPESDAREAIDASTIAADEFSDGEFADSDGDFGI